MSNGENPRGGWFLLAMKGGWGSWCAEFVNGKSTCSKVEYAAYVKEGYESTPIVVMTYEEMDALILRVKEEAVAQYQASLTRRTRKRTLRPSVAVDEVSVFHPPHPE